MSDAPQMSRGQKLALGVAVYMCVKPVFNCLVLGGSLAPLALGFAALICFWFGVKWSNTVIAILLMLVACINLPTNIKGLFTQVSPYLFYTLEGVADMLCACLLAFHPEIRKHCGRP
jgi:hypothetical protein